MAKTTKTVTKDELDGNVALARPANELDRLSFVDPLLRLVQQALGPFVTHRDQCEGDPCTCGLLTALEDLQRREIIVRRYGVIE